MLKHDCLLKCRELDGDFVVKRWHVSHVLVLVNVLVVYNDLWISREPVAAIVVNIQLFVIESIVT